MKWISLVPMSVLLAACASGGMTEYKQVSYTPSVTYTPTVTYTPVTTTRVTPLATTRRCCPAALRTPRCCGTSAVITSPSCCGSTIVTTPVVSSAINIMDTEPVDVTSTTVEYY